MIIEPGHFKENEKQKCCDCGCEIGDHVSYWGWNFCKGCWAEYTNDYPCETHLYYKIDALCKWISSGEFIGKDEELKQEVDGLEELEKLAMAEMHSRKKYENHISTISNRKES